MDDRNMPSERLTSIVQYAILAIGFLLWFLLALFADEPPIVFDKAPPSLGWIMPKGFIKYKQTSYSQRVTVTNGRETILPWRTDQDDVGLNYYTVNPNRSFPYAVPAGLDAAKDWTSETYYSLPEGAKIKAWTSRVPIAMGGLLPKRNWRFPDGTAFLEVLRNSEHKVFEVRKREVSRGKFISSVQHRDMLAAPEGYTGKLARSCALCHAGAGSSEVYGICVRGSSGVFSFPVLKDGTIDWDTSLPLEILNGPPADEPQPIIMEPHDAVAEPRPAGQQLLQPSLPGVSHRRFFRRPGG